MGDILIHLASSMLRLLGLWSCGDRVSDLHQIPRPAGPAVQRTRAEPAPLRMDVAQFDVGITHQPVAPLGLEDADRLADQRLADKDQLAGPFDLAVAAHAAHRNLVAIVRIRDPGSAAAQAHTARPGSAVPAPRAAAHCCRPCGTRRTVSAGLANWRPEASPSLG